MTDTNTPELLPFSEWLKKYHSELKTIADALAESPQRLSLTITPTPQGNGFEASVKPVGEA